MKRYLLALGLVAGCMVAGMAAEKSCCCGQETSCCAKSCACGDCDCGRKCDKDDTGRSKGHPGTTYKR